MRKILSIALALLFVASVCFAAGPTLNSSGDIMGQNKYSYDPHRIFRLVHVQPAVNDSDGIAAGSVVVWDDVLDDGVSVETTTTSGDGRVAGILINTVVSNDTGASGATASDDAGMNANWGWLQTYGLNEDNVNGTTVLTSGSSICAGATAGVFSEMLIGTCTTNAGILGSALSGAAASGTDTPIFITCD